MRSDHGHDCEPGWRVRELVPWILPPGPGGGQELHLLLWQVEDVQSDEGFYVVTFNCTEQRWECACKHGRTGLHCNHLAQVRLQLIREHEIGGP